MTSHNITTISIVIGALSFALSLFALTQFLQKDSKDITFVLSEKTNYFEGIDGSIDTLFIGGGEELQLHLNTLRAVSGISVIPVDSIVKNPETHILRSKHIKGYVFQSKDKELLKNTIHELDKKITSDKITRLKENSFFINLHPRVLLWMIMISIAVSFSISIIPVLLSIIYLNSKEVPRKQIFLNIGATVLIIFVLILPYLLRTESELIRIVAPSDVASIWGIGFKSGVMIAVAILPYIGGLFWLLCIISINARLSYLSKNEPEQAVNILDSTKTIIDRLFIVMGIILAFGIVCTDILIQTFNELIFSEKGFKLFPNEFGMINGIIQTFLLSLVYVYSRMNFLFIKSKLNDSGTEAAKERIKELDEKSGFINILRITLALLAPILGGLIEPLFQAILNLGQN